MLNKILYLLLFSSVALLYWGCSPQKTTTVSKAFHNTTSHYNAYFYALENIKSIERTINSSIVNDYDEILSIFPEIDTTLAHSYQTEIDEAIKMASLAIQRHPNSKWVDDSYLLIGLARYYSLDFVNAIQTFKFINTKSENDNTRHLALIYLLRTFTDYGEYNNAVAVSDYLKKEKLNQHNTKLLHIYRAYYYQVRGDLDNMLTNLVNAAPDLSLNDGKDRMYFIIAQNYQALGFDAEAYNYYRKCLASNPEYELDFYSRLNMAQVVQLSKNSTVREIRKEFNKMLTDKKNKEFKDKIYYEMAEFEMRQNNINEALSYYNSSVRSGSNRKQKGLSYLKMGEIYYDTLGNYQYAQAYYDSSLTNLPNDYKGYSEISEIHRVLSNFVTQINTIQLQDSLLELSNMDSATVISYLKAHLEEKREKEEEEEKERLKNSKTVASNVFDTGNQSNTSNWYFGSQTAVAMGQNEFQRIWGDIKLEDNWRRSFKDQTNSTLDTNVENNITSNQQGTMPTTTASFGNEEINNLYMTIPHSEEDRQLAHDKIEEAYYNLGKIYHFDLKESENAAKHFEILLEKYPESIYNTEAMYLLYLIYGQIEEETKAENYKNILLSEFPNSTFSRLIINPNYTKESSQTAEKLKLLYDSAYTFFINDDFINSRKIISHALTNFEQIKISDRFKILNLLIIGKTENITQYQYELDQFIKNNPESELNGYAKELLEASRTFQDRLLKSNVKFIEYFEQEHYV
ncbi:MAG: tetratricopeptide repeat protein, partial [Cyclobacteriaceae bacterium]|nr:tetratricopeptide repeat protein [Cyclobacteriaceae bacterium]